MSQAKLTVDTGKKRRKQRREGKNNKNDVNDDDDDDDDATQQPASRTQPAQLLIYYHTVSFISNYSPEVIST